MRLIYDYGYHVPWLFFAGKSTVAALLERFYEIGQGKITLDGEDIKDLDPSWLRGRAIGFINQVCLYTITV